MTAGLDGEMRGYFIAQSTRNVLTIRGGTGRPLLGADCPVESRHGQTAADGGLPVPPARIRMGPHPVGDQCPSAPVVSFSSSDKPGPTAVDGFACGLAGASSDATTPTARMPTITDSEIQVGSG